MHSLISFLHTLTLETGVRVGPYQIAAPLGAGGMGEVYVARDERLGRDTALKILSARLSTSAEHLRRFEQEARAASALNHPNIITIYDIGRVDDTAYIAMELIEGKDIRSMLAAGVLPLKQALRIAVKVADGLAAAHERGIVHRDLKPENVMVSRDGFVKILDFGLAKLVKPVDDRDTTLPHTTPGAVFGTVGYMSPEQAAGRDVDFRSDQFALGVILYEMLTGRMPFSEPTAAETLAAIIRTDPPPLTRYNERIPPEIERIVNRLLSKDPSERYASTRDLARDLREIRDRTTNASEPRLSDAHAVRPRPRTFLAAALVVLAAVVGGAIWISRTRVVPDPSVQAAPVARAVAVFPFRDLSATREGQMLSDGVAATVSARLAQVSGLRVAAPFSGGSILADDPREFARRTGADVVLQGDLQRAGEQVRVSFSLLEPVSGTQVGGDTITGTIDELFRLQDQVAERVMEKLRIRGAAVPSPRKTSLTTAAEQQAFVEAEGLLWRLRDDEAVEQAIARLESLLHNARDSADVNGLLGRAYLTRYRRLKRPGDLEQARLFADRAVTLDPDLPEAHVTLGEVYSSTGKLPEAERELRRALELQPSLADAVVALGDVLQLLGRSADAEREYVRAAELAPDWQNVFAKLGGFYYHRGDYRGAIRHWQRHAELVPDSHRPYSNLGIAYQALGDHQRALEHYERSLSLQPSAAAYSNRGTCLYILERYADAATSFERATELAPDDAVVWMNLGDARRWAGAAAGANAAYERAIRAAMVEAASNPKDPRPHVVMAASFAKSGKPAQAKTAIDEALRLDPTSAEGLYQAAVIAAIRKDRDSAVAWLRRAVAAGYPAPSAARDPELRELRDDSTFQEAIRESTRS